MNKIFSKIVSAVTATAVSLFCSSGSIPVFIDAIETSAAETKIIYGDVNEDNRVDVFDLAMIKHECVEPQGIINLEAADVTSDGIVDINDAREVQQFLLCQRTSFTASTRERLDLTDTSIASTDEPIETSLTAEMAAKADELGSAVAVYNYLYNNMRSEFYYGSRKGAIGAYEQGGGNDVDLSSLLIAMLRYLGYDADYVTSIAGFSEEQLLKWTNTTSIDVAHSICSSQGRENTTYEYEGVTYYFYDYKYVQVVDSGNTYYLDICFKEYENQDTVYDAIDNEYTLTNADAILSNTDIVAFNAEIEQSELSASKLEGKSYAFYSKKIVQKNISTLSTVSPHSFDIEPTVAESLTDAESDLVFIGFNSSSQKTFRSADLYKKNITVSYEVSSDSKELGELLGVNTSSIFTLPSQELGQAYSVTPVIKIDGVTVLTGPSLTIGESQILYIATKTGGVSQTYEEELTAGEMCSIVLDLGNISANELSEAYSKTLEKTEKINQLNGFAENMSNNSLSEANVYTSDYLGNMLHLTGVMYFSQLDITTQAMAERNDIHCENTLRFGIIGFKPSVYTGASWVEGQKDGIQKEGQYFVDILSNTVMPFSKTGEQSAVRAFNFNRGFSSSELESTVLEEVLNVESLSTAALFRYAQENDIPLVTLSATSETKVSELNISSDDITLIQAEIDEGNTVVTMQSSVTLGSWNGIGYIVISPDGSTQEYMISGGYNGGITFDLVGLYYTINVALDLALICESVVVLTGILATMSSLAIVPVALVLLSVVSIELLAFDILEQSFLYYEYMFEDDAEAGMEIWLSTVTNSTLTLLTMGIGKAISTVSTHVAGARLASAYGSSTINNIKNAGFTTAEINSKVKFFKSLGLTQNTINTLLKDAKCMYLGDDILNVISKSGSLSDDLAKLVLNHGDDFSELVITTFANDGITGVNSLVGTFGDSYLVWYRITATADNMASTSIPATFQVRLKVDYVNPNTGTNVLWTNANGSEHMQQYLSQFGGENFSTNLRSQLLLESYTSALDDAMDYLITQPAGRYENLSYGGWVFGIDTSTGTVFHAFPEWVIS